MPETVVTTVPIFENVEWSSNQPKIYLTYTYDLKKQGDKILNRDKTSYTFFNLTLTVSMPGKYAYYGYSIYATAVSGNQRSASVMIKDRQPQYWKQYSYNFGDFKVSVPKDSNSVSIAVLMGTNAPPYHIDRQVIYRQVDDIENVRVVLPAGEKLIKENLGSWTEITPNNLDLAINTVVDRKIQSTYLPKGSDYPEVVKIEKWGYNAKTDPQQGYFKYEAVKVGDHPEADGYKDYKTEIEDRNGMLFGWEDFYIGSAYLLPTVGELNLTQIGGMAIAFSSSYTPKYDGSVDTDDWKWVAKLFELDQGEYVEIPTQEDNVSDSIYSNVFYELNPEKTYKISIKFGEDGNWTEEKYKIIPPRFGFYVYYNDQWNYCQTNVGVKGQQDMVSFEQYKVPCLGIGNQFIRCKTIQDDGTLESGIEDE